MTAPKAAWRGGSALDAPFAILSACFKPPITVLAVLDDVDGDETGAGGGPVVVGEAAWAVVSPEGAGAIFSGRGEVLDVGARWVVWAGGMQGVSAVVDGSTARICASFSPPEVTDDCV